MVVPNWNIYCVQLILKREKNEIIYCNIIRIRSAFECL